MFQLCPLSADWGDVATWFGAVSTFAAAVAVIMIARRDIRHRKADTVERRIAKAASYAYFLTHVKFLCQAAIAEKEKYEAAKPGEPPSDAVKFMARKWMALDSSPLSPGADFSPLDPKLIFNLSEVGSVLERTKQRISDGLEHPEVRIGVGHVMVAAGENLLPKIQAALESIWDITKTETPKYWKNQASHE